MHAAQTTRRVLLMKVCESALAAPCSFDDVANVAVDFVMSLTSNIHIITSLPCRTADIKKMALEMAEVWHVLTCSAGGLSFMT